MLKRLTGLLFLFLFLTAASLSAQRPEQIDVAALKEKYVRIVLASHVGEKQTLYADVLSTMKREKEVSDQSVVELEHRYPIRAEEISQILRKQQADGSWSDINYADTKRSGWEPKQHAERTLMLAKYYAAHPGQGDTVAQAIHRSLRYWFDTKPVCRNWWYNQIGVPKTFGQVFLLFERHLSPDERRAAIGVMKNSRFGMTGQNKVWLAGNVLVRALLEDDARLVQQARDTICSEIVLGRPEGIKADWSFHQHGAQQQFGNYGLAYLSNMSFYSELFADTPLRLSKKQLDVLVSFLLEGYRWIVWKGKMDVNCLNRQLFHNADVHKGLITLFAAHSLMNSCKGRQARQIKAFIRDNFTGQGQSTSFVGHKHFAESDMTVHRSAHWMASIRMASRRVIGTELVNEDNLKGYYMADGACYTYVHGSEYHNIFPLWDWRRIPGITTYDSNAPIPRRYGKDARNHTYRVGGCTDGNTGITAMRLNRNGLKANKAWICTDAYILCLGSGITTDSLAPLITSVEQRLQQGDVWQDGAGRYFHDGTGYVVLDADSCSLRCEEQRGAWNDFMGMYSAAFRSEGNVFSLTLHHAAKQQSPFSTYQYVILPATDREQTAAFEAPFRVIRNDEAAQIVALGKRYFVAAYAPVRFLAGKTPITVSHPGTYVYNRKGKAIVGQPFRSYEKEPEE